MKSSDQTLRRPMKNGWHELDNINSSSDIDTPPHGACIVHYSHCVNDERRYCIKDIGRWLLFGPPDCAERAFRFERCSFIAALH